MTLLIVIAPLLYVFTGVKRPYAQGLRGAGGIGVLRRSANSPSIEYKQKLFYLFKIISY